MKEYLYLIIKINVFDEPSVLKKAKNFAEIQEFMKNNFNIEDSPILRHYHIKNDNIYVVDNIEAK